MTNAMLNKIIKLFFKPNKYDRALLEKAGICAGNHRAIITESEFCACFHCENKFPPKDIETWVVEENTAMCPKCGIDAVIGSDSGLPIEDSVFLKEANVFFFGKKNR
ncbi:MAG: hypothetical protein R6W75_05555 [Smithellaceae bacterium]